jgi:hypothetical protein
MFFRIERIEQFSAVGLIEFGAIERAGRYYVRKLAANKAEWTTYLQQTEHIEVVAFLQRFPEWVSPASAKAGSVREDGGA